MALVTSCAGPVGRRPTECIAPANPGGGWDLTCRSVGRVLDELDLVTGTVRITNMPGAAGGLALAHAYAQRRGDPNVLVAASPSTTLSLAQRRFGRLSERDVRWVAAVGTEYGALAIRRDAPWGTLDEFVSAWRRDPSAIIVGGGSAVAGQDHMKVLLLAQAAGIDPRAVRYVAFDGGGEALTTLLGGFIDVFSGEASELLPHLEAGTVRLLTVLAGSRLSGPLAGVPTAIESGWNVEWATWRGFYIPRDVADSSYAQWVERLTRVAESEQWARLRSANRLEPLFVAGREFERLIRSEVERFRAISRSVGLME